MQVLMPPFVSKQQATLQQATLQQAMFEKRALDYDKATPIQTQVAQVVASRIVKAALIPLVLDNAPLENQATPQTIWLDIGCGTGKLSEAVLIEMGKMRKQNQGATSAGLRPFSPDTLATTCQLWGVDSSRSMLACYETKLNSVLANAEFFNKPLDDNFGIINAKPIAPTSLPVAVHTCCADMRALPFLSHSARLIMSSFALHWATPQTLAGLLALLSSQGQLHVAIPVAGSFSQVKAQFSELPIFPFLPEQAWLTALAESLPSGSKILYAESQRFSHAYASLRDLLRDLKKMGGTVTFDTMMNPSVLRHYLYTTTPVTLDYQVLMLGVQR